MISQVHNKSRNIFTAQTLEEAGREADASPALAEPATGDGRAAPAWPPDVSPPAAPEARASPASACGGVDEVAAIAWQIAAERETHLPTQKLDGEVT